MRKDFVKSRSQFNYTCGLKFGGILIWGPFIKSLQ